MGRRWGAFLLLLVAGWSQAATPPRYTPAMLRAVSFDERVRSAVQTQAGAASRAEVIGRDGRWQLRVAADSLPIRLEAWYDSLVVWREGPEGRLVPDTDGLIGGRYRGTLSADGRFTPGTRPFVPDDVAEVTDLGGALTTFLPPLPRAALAVGGRWDEGGVRIVRRSDSTVSGVPLARYRWIRTAADTAREGGADSLAWSVRTRLQEQGDLVWHPVLGPLAWRRTTIMELDIPVEGPVRRAARTRIEEEARAWRRSRP